MLKQIVIMFSAFSKLPSAWAKNPFNTYFKIGSIGFGGTFLGNVIWTSIDSNAPLSIKENPEIYSACLLAKSTYAGFLWPAIPFRIYKNPRRFFCVGGGIQESTFEAFNGEHTLNSVEDLDLNYIRKGLENGTIRIQINGEDAKDCWEYLKKNSNN